MNEELNAAAQTAWQQSELQVLRERIEILEHVLRRHVRDHPELFPPATEQVYLAEDRWTRRRT